MVKTVLGLTHRKTYKIIQKSSFSEPKASDAWYFICSIAWKTSYKFFLNGGSESNQLCSKKDSAS